MTKKHDTWLYYYKNVIDNNWCRKKRITRWKINALLVDHVFFRWLSIFFKSTSKNLDATGCGCDLAQGKVAHGLLVYTWACHVFSGRTRGAYIQPKCHTNSVDMLSNTRIYACLCTRLLVHDVVRALLSYSRRPSGSPRWCAGRVVYARARERVWHSCREIDRRSFTNSQRPKFWPWKINEDTSYQFPSRADVSRMFSCSLKHLPFTCLLRSYGGSSSKISLRWQAISNWQCWFTRDRDSCVDIQFTSLQRLQAIIVRGDLFYEYFQFLQKIIL